MVSDVTSVTMIYGHYTISMLWGNMTYRVKSEISKILLPSFV